MGMKLIAYTFNYPHRPIVSSTNGRVHKRNPNGRQSPLYSNCIDDHSLGLAFFQLSSPVLEIEKIEPVNTTAQHIYKFLLPNSLPAFISTFLSINLAFRSSIQKSKSKWSDNP